MDMKKMMRTIAAIGMGISLTCCTQPGTEKYESTIVNPDGTVTFQYKNDHAKGHLSQLIY